MLNQSQLALINEPIINLQGHCTGFRRDFLREEVVELVLECVHPSNLGALPPSPDMIAYKAIQIGIITKYSEAYVSKRTGQFN